MENFCGRKLPLKVGEYRVLLQDANSHLVEYHFSVVEAAKPDYPASLTDESLEDATRIALQATWLAKQDNGKWSFESYQQAAAFLGQSDCQREAE